LVFAWYTGPLYVWYYQQAQLAKKDPENSKLKFKTSAQKLLSLNRIWQPFYGLHMAVREIRAGNWQLLAGDFMHLEAGWLRDHSGALYIGLMGSAMCLPGIAVMHIAWGWSWPIIALVIAQSAYMICFNVGGLLTELRHLAKEE